MRAPARSVCRRRTPPQSAQPASHSEVGAHKTARTSRARLVRTVREKCQAEGIGGAMWEAHNSMKLFDSTAGTWVPPIIDALLP